MIVRFEDQEEIENVPYLKVDVEYKAETIAYDPPTDSFVIILTSRIVELVR